MSISGISSDPTVSQNYASSPFQQIRKDFAALGKALQSGNVSDAQAAYTTLQTDMQAAGQSGTGANSQFSTDLAAVGAALGFSSNSSTPGQGGSIPAAQTAFNTLQSDMQQARQTQGGQQTQKTHHHHHHHHGGGTQNAQNTTSNPLSDLAAIGNALQSGNLSGAQSAFQTLQQDMGTSSAQSTTATPGTQSTTATPGGDLTALGNALSGAGNLSDAQAAFNTLMQDLQNSIGTLGSGASGAIGTSIDVAT